MRKICTAIAILIFTANTYAQIIYEKGYYITNADEKIDCLIKNVDWENNPTDIDYKINENSEKKNITINKIKEFGIYDISKFVRANVAIDRSSNSLNKMSYKKEPVFKDELLFLKVLVEGESNLYEYVDRNLYRYFIKTEEIDLEQLIYKEYLTGQSKILKNLGYKSQLWKYLKCSTFSIKTVEKINYKRRDLVSFFIAYNTCNDHTYETYSKKQKRDFFNLSIRPGINSSSLSIDNFTTSNPIVTADFDTETSYRFGIEAEFILPFNKNKWAFIIEPTYQSYASTFDFENDGITVDYASIELPVGVRHYFFLNKNSKIFVNGAAIVDLVIGDSALTYNSGRVLEIKPIANFGYGIGFKYKNKYSIEVRNQTNKNLLRSFRFWNSQYRTLSLIVGYSFF